MPHAVVARHKAPVSTESRVAVAQSGSLIGADYRAGSGLVCVANIKAIEELTHVLCNDTRLEILAVLDGTSLDVSSIAQQLDLAVDRISHHLRDLRRLMLVDYVREGNRKIYSLTDEVQFSIDTTMHSVTVHPNHTVSITVNVRI